MTSVCQKVLAEGILTLKDAYNEACEGSHYSPFNARRRLLQMPLACICVNFKPGHTECYVIEHNTANNYASVCALLHTVACKQSNDIKMDKATVKELLQLCTSNEERQTVRYAVCKASGLSATQAKKTFGFRNVSTLTKRVEKAIEHAKYIREAIDQIARIEEKSAVTTLVSDSESDVSDVEPSVGDNPSFEDVIDKITISVVQACCFNWFEIVDTIPDIQNASLDTVRSINDLSHLPNGQSQ